MPEPTISVCIPAFRAERYLTASLASVASQQFTDWEIVVTEDGSQDGTEKIVRDFARTVSQPVRYERHPKNLGLAATRNTGIASAAGEWVAFLDADDYWLPGHLQALIAHATAADMVFSGTVPFEDETGKALTPLTPTPDDLRDLPAALYSGRLSILPSAVMLRRDVFKTVGPVSTDYPSVNDTEYWLRLLRAGKTAAYSGADTCCYRKHAASMSRNAVRMLTESADLCAAYADWSALPRSLSRRRPAELYRWAAATIRPENPSQAVHLLRRSLKHHLLSVKTLGLLAKTLLRRPRLLSLKNDPSRTPVSPN